MRKKPRQNSLVRFMSENLSPAFLTKYPFTRDGVYIYLGEIPNMPGHCIVVDYKSGKFHAGYHTENFTEIPQDET